MPSDLAGKAISSNLLVMIRHFTATVYVVDDDHRFLLLWHGKLRRWMPPGGHVEENELPEDAAIRECKEETGLDVEIIDAEHIDLYENNRREGRMMKRPAMMLLEEIPAFAGSAKKPPYEAHQHMDFVFIARRKNSSQAIVTETAEEHVRWFSSDEIRALPDDQIYTNVREFILLHNKGA